MNTKLLLELYLFTSLYLPFIKGKEIIQFRHRNQVRENKYLEDIDLGSSNIAASQILDAKPSFDELR